MNALGVGFIILQRIMKSASVAVKEVLRINPNNETAKKKLDELINSKPLFPIPELPITGP